MPINFKSTITPIHLGIAVAVVVIAIVMLPMINSAYETAYPPVGSTKRFIVDQCAENDGSFSRWSPEDVHDCLVGYSTKPRKPGPYLEPNDSDYLARLRRQSLSPRKSD
jgi:hypothetical protein